MSDACTGLRSVECTFPVTDELLTYWTESDHSRFKIRFNACCGRLQKRVGIGDVVADQGSTEMRFHALTKQIAEQKQPQRTAGTHVNIIIVRGTRDYICSQKSWERQP